MPDRIYLLPGLTRYFVLIGLPVILLACRSEGPVRITEIVRIQITATPRPATGTPIPTPSLTLTPTPTPTAVSVTITGDPYLDTISGPTPAPGAYCGFVDTFDYPINPPDASGIRGGQDFGVFRSRYGKYHAGEDWGFRGGAGFGDSVYAIGHGTVTYADGLGWGPDQGVVIIRHYFPDGSTVLSFYGHLDPPSVTLVPGSCITRGTQVGRIGRPRTSPHLHFEIRTTMPFVPGPGYWTEDPTTAGWLPPSAYIAEYRMAKNPGTRWVRSDIDVDDLLGTLDPETIVVLEGRRLMGLYSPGGGARWVHELASRPTAAAVSGGRVFVLSLNGMLEAFRYPEAGDELLEGAALTAVWQLPVGSPTRLSLAVPPWEGILLVGDGAITSISPDGIVAWREEISGAVNGWTTGKDEWLVSVTGEGGGVWIFDESGLQQVIEGPPGALAAASDGIYRLGRASLALLDKGAGETFTVLELLEGLREGEIVSVPGGGVLVLHADPADYRLLFVRGGSLVWERSVKTALEAGAQLISDGEEVYVLAREVNGNAETVALLRIAIDSASLEKIFVGGTRFPAPSRPDWISPSAGELLFRFGLDSLVLFASQNP